MVRTIMHYDECKNQELRKITKGATKDIVHLNDDFSNLGWDVN
jgi:hypothetical protein